MSDFKAGCSPITARIYAGTVKKNGMWGKNKHDITDTAPQAVAQHLILRDEAMLFTYRDERYVLRVQKLESDESDK